MIFQYSPFFIPLLIAAAITGALAVISFRRRSDPIILYFILLMGATTLWILAYAVQISSADLGTNLTMITIAYLGIMTIPVVWLFLILCYLGYVNLITPRNSLLLLIVPIAVVLLVATNTWHHLVYTAFAPEAIDGVIIWNFFPGPLYWFALGYSYLLLVITFLLIASRYLHSPAVYRKQILILLIAAGIPFLANILFVSQVNPFPGLNITPFSFRLAASAAFLA
ncbi:MAG TPA: histidine kinase N-terminal 7TM domain-containing protein, partial [Methanoregula sp.]|nr:histidine kinase N-terminal 7TM domain-containing protein [Methanoregula sp.]